MSKKTIHRLITVIVAVIMIVTALLFTDGVKDSWKDWFLLLYPCSIVWLYFREAGYLKFKK